MVAIAIITLLKNTEIDHVMVIPIHSYYSSHMTFRAYWFP